MSDESDSKCPRRRDFLGALTTGGIAGGALVGLSGCLSTLERSSSTSHLSEEEISNRLSRLEADLEALSDRRFVSDNVLGSSTDEVDAESQQFFDRTDDMTGRTLRALTVMGFYIDLPEATRTLPTVQERVERYLPDLGETLAENYTLLSNYPSEELTDVEAILREDPSQVMQLCEALDRGGRDQGLERRSRRFIRSLGRRWSNSLRHRPLAEILEESTSAMRELLDENSIDMAALQEVGSQMVGSLWIDVQEQNEALSKSPEEGSNPPPPPPSHPCVTETGEGFVINARCDEVAPDEQSDESPGEQSEESLREEWESWRRARNLRQGDASVSHRRFRIGRSLAIWGSVLFIACGVGIFILVPGIIMIAASGRHRIERDRRRRERERLERAWKGGA